MDVADWLRELGLERYEEAFRENQIDAAILPKLTADDLRGIGIAAVGHRRKLLEAQPLPSGSRTKSGELAMPQKASSRW